MQHTQISLTTNPSQRVAEVARDLSIPTAEVVRRALDRVLGTGDTEQEERAVIAATASILADDPDWPEWLAGVRGQNADERLRSLGLRPSSTPRS